MGGAQNFDAFDRELNKQYLSTKQGGKQQSKQGGGLVDWLPAIGAIGGSFIPGAGTIAGGALGAGAGALLKQSMVGGGPEDIVKEAALGGAGGVLGKGIGAIAGKVLPKAATQVAGQIVAKSATGIGEKFAAKTIASNFTIPPKLAPQLQLEDSLGQMIKDGIKIPNSILTLNNTLTLKVSSSPSLILFSKKSSTTFTAANRSSFKAVKETITLYTGERNYECPFYFSDTLPHETPIILGQLGFFDHFKITFDLKNKEIEIV